MKNRIFISLLLGLALQLHAFETGFTSEFGNYGLSDYNMSSTEYVPYFQWGASIFYNNEVSDRDDLRYETILEHDMVKGYSLKTSLHFIQPYYSISIGPVFGIVNQSWTLIKPGFTGKARAEIPGTVFAEIGGDVIPSNYTGLNSDYSVESVYWTLGFYLNKDHIICSFSQFSDRYTNMSVSDFYSDYYLAYIFNAEFFDKSSIVNVITRGGYEILTRTFDSSNAIQIKNILVGIEFDVSMGSNTEFFIGIDNKIYPSSSGSIVLQDVPSYLVTVSSGFKWKQ